MQKGEKHMYNKKNVRSFFISTGIAHGNGYTGPERRWVEVLATDKVAAMEIFEQYFEKPPHIHVGRRIEEAGRFEHLFGPLINYPIPRIGLYWPDWAAEKREEEERKAAEERRLQAEAEVLEAWKEMHSENREP